MAAFLAGSAIDRRHRDVDEVAGQDVLGVHQGGGAVGVRGDDRVAVGRQRVDLVGQQRGQAVAGRQRNRLDVGPGQPGLLQRLEQEVVRRGVLHVGDLLALQAGDVGDGAALGDHHFLGQGGALPDGDDVQRAGPAGLGGEDRWDLAGAGQVERAGAQRLELQVAALEQAELGLVRGVGQIRRSPAAVPAASNRSRRSAGSPPRGRPRSGGVGRILKRLRQPEFCGCGRHVRRCCCSRCSPSGDDPQAARTTTSPNAVAMAVARRRMLGRLVIGGLSGGCTEDGSGRRRTGWCAGVSAANAKRVGQSVDGERQVVDGR